MSAQIRTSNYDTVASHYDSTRDMPPELLEDCFRRAQTMSILDQEAVVLDAGCGTAQLSFPLIQRGFRVVGVDVSKNMLDIARMKAALFTNASFQEADVRELPFQSETFDVILVSKLFQHVGGWQDAVAELVRVLKAGRYVLHINEKNAFKNKVRSHFSGLCAASGYKNLYVGINDRSELAGEFARRGAPSETFDASNLSWIKRITYRDAYEHLRLRLHSEFWALPEQRYEEFLCRTSEWIEDQPERWDTVETMTPHLTVEAFRKNS